MHFLQAILIVLFLPSPMKAEVRLMFLSQKSTQGTPIQFESGGKFVHSAIFYQGQWLQAHPYYGVQLTSLNEVKKMGSESFLMTIQELPEPTEHEVAAFLGKKFDFNYSWTDETIYCSELLAKLLRIPPTPMIFDPQLWPPGYEKFNGLPGVSPDDLAQYFTEKGYTLIPVKK